MGSTTGLRRAVKTGFFPILIDRGFALDERDQPRSTTLRRGVGVTVQILEVRWDKYGRPRFAVHFGTCPADGLRVDETLHAPGAVLATWCPDAGTLQPGRLSAAGAWFRQDVTIWQRLLGRPALRDPSVVVNELVALFPEVERYWERGDVGPHLRLWRRDAGAPNPPDTDACRSSPQTRP